MKRTVLLASILSLPVVASAQIDLRLTEVASLAGVVDIKHAGDQSGRLFLVLKSGAVRILKDGELLTEPFLELSDQVSGGPEQGLLSVAFAPDYAQSGRFYVYFTDLVGSSVMARYRISSDPDIADPQSRQVLLIQPQPFGNHNGGRLEFGPDGMLYLGLGDGGSANDPLGAGQDTGTVLGSIIRLDVSGDGDYAIPPNNPFVSGEGADEIWAYGLRNPWRMAFDRLTGDLYIADVGQNLVEEIDFQPAASSGGENYGWNIREGSHCFVGDCDTPGLTDPVWEYLHGEGNCSITGGQVYRGPDYPAMVGRYLYGDFCSGRIWAYHHPSRTNELLSDGQVSNILTFGEDERGNVYVSASGRVFLLSDGPPVITPSGVPIDGSTSGTYVVEGLNDQGFFVTVGQNPSGVFLFVAWFTFDESGNPRWLVGVDFFEPGAISVSLLMQEVRGLNFLDFSSDSAERIDFGTMTFTQLECGTLEADFNFGAAGAGSLTLDKLTNIEGRDC